MANKQWSTEEVGALVAVHPCKYCGEDSPIWSVLSSTPVCSSCSHGLVNVVEWAINFVDDQLVSDFKYGKHFNGGAFFRLAEAIVEFSKQREKSPDKID